MKLRWLVAAAIVAAAAGAIAYAARPPRPDLALPSGYQLERVVGHCVEGSELYQCAAGDGPRSTLTIRSKGGSRADYPTIRDFLLAHGWNPVNGQICRHGQGCLSFHGTMDTTRVIVDWWETGHTECRSRNSVALDPVNCSAVR